VWYFYYTMMAIFFLMCDRERKFMKIFFEHEKLYFLNIHGMHSWKDKVWLEQIENYIRGWMIKFFISRKIFYVSDSVIGINWQKSTEIFYWWSILCFMFELIKFKKSTGNYSVGAKFELNFLDFIMEIQLDYWKLKSCFISFCGKEFIFRPISGLKKGWLEIEIKNLKAQNSNK
jgi:hypothetical protein